MKQIYSCNQKPLLKSQLVFEDFTRLLIKIII